MSETETAIIFQYTANMKKFIITICIGVLLNGLTVINAQEEPPQKVPTSTGIYDVESPDDLRKFSAADIRKLVEIENGRYHGTGSVPHPVLVYCFKEKSFQYTGGKYKDATIKYRLHTPRTTGFGRYPLVVHLHGAGEAGSNNTSSLVHLHSILPLMVGPEQQDFFLLVVQCPQDNRGWNFKPSKDGTLDVLTAAIADVIANNPINRNRITVTGVSSGGWGTWQLLLQNPDMFAGAVPTSCGTPPFSGKIRALKKTPLWLICNKDVALPPIEMAMNAINNSGGLMAVTQGESSDHNAWKPAMEKYNCFQWLIAQRRGSWFAPPPGVVVGRPNSLPFLFVMLFIPLCIIIAALFFLREQISERLSSLYEYFRQMFEAEE